MTTEQQRWISEIKNLLLITEKENLQMRCTAFEKAMKKAAQIARDLLRRTSLTFKIKFDCNFEFKVKIEKYLLYIEKWNGLNEKKMKKSQNSSKHLIDKESYMKKAKNWLNGKKAPEYSQSLFSEMIQSIYKYTSEMAKSIIFFADNANGNERLQFKFQEYLIFLFLYEIFRTKLSLNDKTKKTYLICSNALKKNKKLLSPYINDFNFDCIQAVITFAEMTAAEKLQEFKTEFDKLQRNNSSETLDSNLSKNSYSNSNAFFEYKHNNEIQHVNDSDAINQNLVNIANENFHFGSTCCCNEDTMTSSMNWNCSHKSNASVCNFNSFPYNGGNQYCDSDIYFCGEHGDNDMKCCCNDNSCEMSLNGSNCGQFECNCIHNNVNEICDHSEQMNLDYDDNKTDNRTIIDNNMFYQWDMNPLDRDSLLNNNNYIFEPDSLRLPYSDKWNRCFHW